METLKSLSRVAEVELVYKTKVKASDRPKANSPGATYELFKLSWNEDTMYLRETFKVMLLNAANNVLGIYEVSTGGVTSTSVDAKMVFAPALKAMATNIVLCHNHPSGNLKPSQEDRKVTAKLAEAGKYLDIVVLDHLIISGDHYYSFADDGLL